MITFYKILSSKKHIDGKQIVTFVLSDGTDKRQSILSGLPDDETKAKEMILARGQELFNKGKFYDDSDNNVDCFKKEIKRVAQNVNNITDPVLKEILIDLTKIIKDLSNV